MKKLEDVTVVHNGTECDVLFGRYDDGGRTAIRLVERATGEPYATATVNIPEAPLGPDQVLIKDYSENVGVLAALVAAGVVESLGWQVATGYTAVPVCRLLKAPADY